MENKTNIKINTNAGQIILVNCRNITISEQNIESTDIAIELWNTNNTRIYNSTIQNNSVGVYFEFSGYNIIHSNTIQSNNFGIYLYSSKGNTIYDNIIHNNSYGIYLIHSDNNTIYINCFINNTIQYYLHNSNSRFYSPSPVTYKYKGNIYTSYLGNYWSDYTGTDSDNDGIGDTPYGPDPYPLVEPLEIVVKDTASPNVLNIYLFVITLVLIATAIFIRKYQKKNTVFSPL